jgi:hypothetical protein
MKMLLYVADDVKTMEGGKTMAIGLFTDRVVILNIPASAPAPTQEVPFGVPLTLLACVMDLPATELTGTAKITPPSGIPLMPEQSFQAKGEIGGSTNIQMRFEPFLLSSEGVYTLNLRFDGFEQLSETLELRIKRVDRAKAPVIVRQTVSV